MTQLNEIDDSTRLASKGFKGISSFTLHIIAMSAMLCDHMWATVLSNYSFLTNIGRIAFPIFAFMMVEGYYHTKSLKKYFIRLFIFALISEIPFNLMYAGSIAYPFHQNVIWTFIIGLACISIIDKVSKKKNTALTVIVCTVVTFAGFILGFVGIVDYYGYGILTVLVFYFFRGRKWYNLALQFICIFWINFKMLGGLTLIFNIFGHEIAFVQQGFAILALIPIWLYNGNQGPHNKLIQYTFYAFYPAHMLILALIALYL